MTDRIGVIGGGLAGLAAACTLAARGHRVSLFEANDWVGGKAAVLQKDGFRFDMGPTILTVPVVLERIFGEAGKKISDYLDLIPLDPQWRCFYSDGSVLDLHSDPERMRVTLDQYAPGSAEGYDRFLALSERLHEISERFFFWRSIGGIGDVFDFKSSFSTKVLADVLAMRMGKTVGTTVRHFVPDSRVAQMLDHFTQYVGSSPDASPAVLCGIAHMQTQGGVWYPRGGTRAVPVALAKLAGELGVDIHTNSEVSRISLDDRGRPRSIELKNGSSVPVRAVISNMDSVRTHRELIGPGKSTGKFNARRSYEPACSGVVLYLGLDRAYDHLLHHNFVFSEDPHVEFDAIYNRGIPAPDPTCYVAAPARTEPDVAPPGGEALYILVHTPYLRPGQNWSTMLPEYRRVILRKLATTGGMPDIENRIRFESALTPQDIHDRYRVLDGAIYGLASHGRWLGAFKPANRSPEVPGLYLAGGAAHPGAGMPMVMMSGWIAGDTLDQDHRASAGSRAAVVSGSR